MNDAAEPLTTGVAVNNGNVLVMFNKSIAWLELPPEQAEKLAQLILENVRKAQGALTKG